MSLDVLKGVLLMAAFPVVMLLVGWLLLSQSKILHFPKPVKAGLAIASFVVCGWVAWILATEPDQFALGPIGFAVAIILAQTVQDAERWLRWPSLVMAVSVYVAGAFAWLRDHPPFAGEIYDTLYFLFMAALLIGTAAWEAFRRLRPQSTDNAPTNGTGTSS
jgi:hypothetical protein